MAFYMFSRKSSPWRVLEKNKQANKQKHPVIFLVEKTISYLRLLSMLSEGSSRAMSQPSHPTLIQKISEYLLPAMCWCQLRWFWLHQTENSYSPSLNREAFCYFTSERSPGRLGSGSLDSLGSSRAGFILRLVSRWLLLFHVSYPDRKHPS